MKLLILLIFMVLGIAVVSCTEESGARAPSADLDADGDADADGDTDSDADSDASLVTPVDRGDQKVLEFTAGDDVWRFACTEADGGRIVEFSLNGVNIIADASIDPTCGSTFWTSPQSDWDWPPPPEVDGDAYSADVDEDEGVITLTSPEETSELNVQIVKRFQVDLANRTVVITYTIRNIGTAARSFAPWEITRVAPEGMTFYPQGNGDPTGTSMMPVSRSDGITWFTHSTDLSGNLKLFSDGADGWIASTDGDIILVKKFPDIPASDAAPGEAEIELYTNGNYVEVEQQGAFTEIPAGGERTWQVTWYLREIPDDVDVSEGSASLLAFVESLL